MAWHGVALIRRGLELGCNAMRCDAMRCDAMRREAVLRLSLLTLASEQSLKRERCARCRSCLFPGNLVN
jgi:hypothetical protein